MEKFTGKVWVLDDDIDTDIIIPTEYLALKTIDDIEEEYGVRSMADLDDAITKLGFLDLSPFCAPINRKEKYLDEE